MIVRFAVASNNPVKAAAVQQGFERMFPGIQLTIQPVSVPSGVSAQPMSHRETLTGARNRVNNAAARVPDADYWVGLEGGVEEVSPGNLISFAWVVVRSPERYGQACSAAFYLPPEVARLVLSGMELGEADDIVFSRVNSKQENGAVGLLTGNAMDRAELYAQAVMLALIPFKNPQLFPGEILSSGPE